MFSGLIVRGGTKRGCRSCHATARKIPVVPQAAVGSHKFSTNNIHYVFRTNCEGRDEAGVSIVPRFNGVSLLAKNTRGPQLGPTRNERVSLMRTRSGIWKCTDQGTLDKVQ